MAQVTALRDAVVATIKAAVPSLRTCVPHSGDIDSDELARFYQATPAVLVVVAGLPTTELIGSQVRADVQLAAFVLVSGADANKRADVALALSDALVRLVAQNPWGLADARKPDGVAARNMYAGAVDSQDVALWSVEWRQKLNLDPDLDVDALNAFVTAHADLVSFAPDDGVEHQAAQATITLEQP